MVLQFDFGLRAVAGANEASDKVSLYRGPLLLAWDQAQTTFDEENLPAINLARLGEARLVAPTAQNNALQPKAWLQVEVPAENGSTLRLVDFASAGTAGTRYRSWLPAAKIPPPAFTQYPRDAERVRPGPVQFQWRGARHVPGLNYRVELAGDDAFAGILFATNRLAGPRLVLDLAAFPATPSPDRWWRVITVSTNGETVPDVPPARFTMAADAPALVLAPVSKPGPEGELVLHSLRNNERPKFGELLSSMSGPRGADGTQVKGRDQRLVYAVPAWPEEDFTVAVRVRLDEMPKGRLGQIFSAWAAAMDDPLRLVVQQGKLFARIEAGGVFGTPGVPIDAGRWHSVCAVKRGETLALFLDGQPAGSCAAPRFTTTAARDCALGGNPHFSGDESLTATFADFGFWERALSAEEL
jgi:hypothetical protein